MKIFFGSFIEIVRYRENGRAISMSRLWISLLTVVDGSASLKDLARIDASSRMALTASDKALFGSLVKDIAGIADVKDSRF